VGRTPLTFRRLSGLDRSGPPPAETEAGAPLRPWTIPNAIGFVRAGLLIAFLLLALSSEDGTDPLPVVLFALVAWGDYADGIAARVTGQYSRLGALMDPVIDRALIISGVVVCWKFDLLPRWLLGILIAREVFMLIAGQYAIRHGVTLKINWFGRWAVWPAMSAIFFALCGLKTLATVLLVLGLVLAIAATVQYGRDAVRELRER
jgi:CDP-diacylglycerol--glycerol-3-phosphate 3-phosphatidyltransferase